MCNKACLNNKWSLYSSTLTTLSTFRVEAKKNRFSDDEKNFNWNNGNHSFHLFSCLSRLCGRSFFFFFLVLFLNSFNFPCPHFQYFFFHNSSCNFFVSISLSSFFSDLIQWLHLDVVSQRTFSFPFVQFFFI